MVKSIFLHHLSLRIFTVLLINCSVVCVDTVFMSEESFIPGRGGITSAGDYCTGEDDSL